MKRIHLAMMLAVLCFVCSSKISAQDQQGNQNAGAVRPDSPIPPITAAPQTSLGQAPSASPSEGPSSGPNESSPAYDSQSYAPIQAQPDTHSLSGAELFSVGSLGKSHTIFDPSLSFTDTATNVLGGSPSVVSNVLLGGALNVDHAWGFSHFTASYNGGDNLFIPRTLPSVSYHQLSIEQSVSWARLTLRIRDDLRISPYAFFGGEGMGGPGMLGALSSGVSSQTAISSTLEPGETTIQTGLATRILDTVLGEVDYSLSRQTSISLSGAYGLLHFDSPGFIDSRTVNTQAGINYLLDAKNSIALIGGYGRTDFGGPENYADDYLGEFAYGRKVTGKIGLQLAGGVEQIQTRVVGSPNFQYLTWTTTDALTYSRRRTGYTFYYSNNLSNGSGVLIGALSQTLSGTVSQNLSRWTTISANGGYAYNRSIPTPSAPSALSFSSWYVGARYDRRLGSRVGLDFHYGMQHQTIPASCPVFVCGLSGYIHTLGTTMQWHLRRVGE